MFGHLRIQSCRLGEKDRSIYRSHFCSVCHNLHAFAGRDATVLTNYDVTLWSLVASGVSARDYAGEKPAKPCTALPFRQVQVQTLTPETGASLAALTVLLAWAKFEDHRQDGGYLLGRLGKLWLGGKEKKARDYLAGRGYPLTSMLELPARQAAVERQTVTRLETLAAPTAEALSDAFAWIAVLAERPDLDAGLRRLGAELAAYVYLWDALEDLEKDLKRGAFNAIVAVWGTNFSSSVVKSELWHALDTVSRCLAALPLGNRRKLCDDLVASLRASVENHPTLRGSSVLPPGPRHRLARAGFVRTSDCDCDCGDGCCCEVSCCDCGKGGESGCCDHGSACKVVECCSWIDCCTDWDCCFCCADDGDGDERKEKKQRGGCCGSGKGGGSKGASGAREDQTDHADEEQLLCPGCRHDLPDLGRSVRVCRHCGGAWLEKGASRETLDGMRRPDVSSPPPIPRSSRTCPRCRSLLRTPLNGPQSCDTCYGVFDDRT